MLSSSLVRKMAQGGFSTASGRAEAASP